MSGSLLIPIAAPEYSSVPADLPVRVWFDKAAIPAQEGDTILGAILRQGARIGASEFDGTPRAGFCLMGSCQECTLWDAAGRRLRACMTDVQDGMVLRSTPYADPALDD